MNIYEQSITVPTRLTRVQEDPRTRSLANFLQQDAASSMYIHVPAVLLSQAKLQQFAANSRDELPAGLCVLPSLKFESKVSDLVTMPEDATSRFQLHDDSARPHVDEAYEGKTVTIPTAIYHFLSIFVLTSCISTTTRESAGKDR